MSYFLMILQDVIGFIYETGFVKSDLFLYLSLTDNQK